MRNPFGGRKEVTALMQQDFLPLCQSGWRSKWWFGINKDWLLMYEGLVS
jgi:hypothetical protein